MPMIILGPWETVGRTSNTGPGSAGPARDHLGGLLGGLFGQPRRHAGVGVAGEGAGGVAQEILDDFDIDVCLEGSGGCAVAQIVKPDRRQSKARNKLVEILRY